MDVQGELIYDCEGGGGEVDVQVTIQGCSEANLREKGTLWK